MRILKKIFSPGYPDLDWIQVGVTTRCNADCIYCPHAICRDSWHGRDLSLEDFQALIPAFSKTSLVYLQGWGEPLLHPQLFDMLELVKKKGCMAGLTSNANLLTRDTLKKLADAGLDFLSLSLAGIDGKNDVIRKGTSLKKVRTVIQEVNRIRVDRGTSSPRIHLAYMLLRSGLDDISAMPDFFNSLAVDQVVISGLTLAFTPEMEKQMYLADSHEGYQDIREKLLEMKHAVDESEKINFHLYNPYQNPGQCSENIHKAAFMSVDGYIRPCVCTDFPGFSENQRMFFKGTDYPLSNLGFGNMKDKSLAENWNDPDYKRFREHFFSEDINRPCAHCAKRFIDNLTINNKELKNLTLSIKEKYDLIYSHEEQFAYRLGKEIIKKPEVSVWMILLPVLFVHHMYRVNQYKAGIKSFAQGILDPRKKALGKACDEVSAGKEIPYEVQDYFPGVDIGVEKQKKLAEKQVEVIRIMEQHYFALLKSSGQSFEELFRKVYPTQGDYRLYLNKLKKTEDELYKYLDRKVHTTDESRQVIKNMRKCSQRLHEDELGHFF